MFQKLIKQILLIAIIHSPILMLAQEENWSYEQIVNSDSLLHDYYTNHYISDVDEPDSVVMKFFEGKINPLKSASNYNDVVFSHKAGYYRKKFLLKLSLEDALSQCQIYYTLDGSVPTPSDKRYNAPLLVEEELQSKYGFKAFVIRAVVYAGNIKVSDVRTNVYMIGDALHTRYNFPVISLVTDPDNLFDDDIGIYVKGATYTPTDPQWSGNYHQRGIEWERDVHIQYFTTDGELVIDQDAGVRIHGGLQRTANQKSLRLYARSEYGKSTFDYNLLPQKTKSSYKRFILRTSYGCWNSSIIKDGLSAQLIKGMGVEHQDYRPTIILLNGDYWGIQTLRDYLGSHYFEEEYHINKNSVNICSEKTIHEGAVNLYDDVANVIENYDLTTSSFFNSMEDKLDLQNLMNYYNSEIYLNNYDWPNGNRKFWSSNEYDPKLRWVFFDLDAAFNGRGGVSFNALHKATVPSSGWPNGPSSVELLASLLKNPKFKDLFITNAAYIMNYYFDADTVIPKIRAMEKEYLPEISEHCIRWSFGTVSSWQSTINSALINFAKARRPYVENHYISKFNLSGTSELNLTCEESGVAGQNNSEVGSIYLNKQVIPNNNHSGIYFNDVNIELTAIANSGYEFEKWSDDNFNNPRNILLTNDSKYTAIFKKSSTNHLSIVINEALAKNTKGITDNYNEREDWIELYNQGDYPVNISGLYLTNDLQLPFRWELPESDTLNFSSNEYKLFFADEDIHQGVLHTNFKLSKRGGTIALIKDVNNIPFIIDSLQYPPLDKDVSWGKVENISNEYRRYLIPTPGLANNVFNVSEGLYINEIMASNNNSIKDEYGDYVDWVELYNGNNFDYDIGGIYISDKGSNLTRFQIPTDTPIETTIPAQGYIILFADGNPEKGIKHLNFKLSTNGESLFLSRYDDGVLKILDQISFNSLDTDYSYGRITDANSEFAIFPPKLSTPGSANGVYDGDNSNFIEQVTLSPNPAHKEIKIIANTYINEITIWSLSGETVFRTNCNAKEVTIPVSQLSGGLYIIEIKSELNSERAKLIVY